MELENEIRYFICYAHPPILALLSSTFLGVGICKIFGMKREKKNKTLKKKKRFGLRKREVVSTLIDFGIVNKMEGYFVPWILWQFVNVNFLNIFVSRHSG